MDDQTRLDDNMARYADLILAGRDPAPSEEIASQARIMQMLNQVIAPGEGMDSAMRSRLNQRINEEWDIVQQRRKSRLRILNFSSTYGRLAVAAGFAIVVAIVAIIINMNNTSGSDVTATAQGDSNTLVIVAAVVAVILVSGILFSLWNRRR